MPSQPTVRPAKLTDVTACKIIADAHRSALGFIVAATFVDSIQRHRLFVAEIDGEVIGFLRYNHRVRGDETALYDICVAKNWQRQGIGRMLIATLRESCYVHQRYTIIARCPADLPANAFYARLGFQQVTVEAGRRRPLVLWRLTLAEA